MPVKPARQMAQELDQFIANVQTSLHQLQELKRRLESEPDFQKLWDADSAKALQDVGINPDARMEMGKEAYAMGPECTWCVTPKGNACHC